MRNNDEDISTMAVECLRRLTIGKPAAAVTVWRTSLQSGYGLKMNATAVRAVHSLRDEVAAFDSVCVSSCA